MKIVKPIFILGSGKSGTSLVYNLFSDHPDVCWFSHLTNQYPSHPSLSRFHKLTDIPLLGKKIKYSTFFPYLQPSEGNLIYAYCGFHDDRRMLKKDVTPTMDNLIKHSIVTHLNQTGKRRFLNKRTANTQRIDCLDRLFPDAYYIHVIRNGREVALSLLKSDWWIKIPLWWKEGKTPEELQREGVDLLLLATRHWKQNVEEIKKYKTQLKGRYIEVRYEDFILNVKSIMTQILQFCDLPLYPSYIAGLPSKLENRNRLINVRPIEKERMGIQDTI